MDANSRKEKYIVQKEGEPQTFFVGASGRIVTEPFDMPDWAHNGLSTALLADRNQFYSTRLGSTLAEPLLATNILNYDDLDWVAVDEEGEELVVPCSAEYRQGVLAAALGVDRDTGAIEAAITDHYIARDGKAYTAEEIVSKEQADAALGKQAQQG